MEALNLGQPVKFAIDNKVYTIVDISKPLGTYEVYRVTRANVTRTAFRYQLDPNYDFDSDEDDFLSTINLEDLQNTSQNLPDNKVQTDDRPRFVQVSNTELDLIELQRNEKNTDKQTEWGVRVFKEWSLASGLSPDFEHLGPVEFNVRLRRFYVEARTKKGEQYSKSALIGIRAALTRYLNSPPYSSTINLMHDKEFTSSNQILVGVIKLQKREGKDVTVHKQPISSGDLKKLYSSGVLSCANPTSLLRKVWFDVEFHFGRRGREGLRELRFDSFEFAVDDSNTEYVHMGYNEADKTHHGVDSRERAKQARMYASGDDNCPVGSLRLYLLKRNKLCDAFFQRPLKNPAFDDECWYYNKPIGARTLGDMMSAISAAAGLSRQYTNHCLRATAATVLSEAGVPVQGIMSITGHRNESSLRSYVQQPSVEQQRSFSNILHSAVAAQGTVVSATSTHTETTIVQKSTSETFRLPAFFPNATITGGNINITVNSH